MPGIVDRVNIAVGGSLGTTHGPTQTHREQLEIARRQWSAFRAELTTLVEEAVPAMAARLDAMGIRWTTGRGVPGG
jgi:hypothetical protein